MSHGPHDSTDGSASSAFRRKNREARSDDSAGTPGNDEGTACQRKNVHAQRQPPRCTGGNQPALASWRRTSGYSADGRFPAAGESGLLQTTGKRRVLLGLAIPGSLSPVARIRQQLAPRSAPLQAQHPNFKDEREDKAPDQWKLTGRLIRLTSHALPRLLHGIAVPPGENWWH